MEIERMHILILSGKLFKILITTTTAHLHALLSLTKPTICEYVKRKSISEKKHRKLFIFRLLTYDTFALTLKSTPKYNDQTKTSTNTLACFYNIK